MLSKRAFIIIKEVSYHLHTKEPAIKCTWYRAHGTEHTVESTPYRAHGTEHSTKCLNELTLHTTNPTTHLNF